MKRNGQNIAVITGRVSQVNPIATDVRYGKKSMTVIITTSREWVDRNSGDHVSKVQHHRIVLKNDLVELYSDLKTGDVITVTGEIETRTYNHPQYDEVTMSSTEIHCREIVRICAN